MFERESRAVFLCVALLSGCSTVARESDAGHPATGHHTVAVQCTATNSSSDTPCIAEARRACDSDNVRLQQITLRDSVPVTQGVDQTPMPMTQYAVTYLCSG